MVQSRSRSRDGKFSKNFGGEESHYTFFSGKSEIDFLSVMEYQTLTPQLNFSPKLLINENFRPILSRSMHFTTQALKNYDAKLQVHFGTNLR